MRSMGLPTWRFREIPAPRDGRAMTSEEQALAKRLTDALPDHYPNKAAVIVRMHKRASDIDEALRPVKTRDNPAQTEVIQTLVPITDHTVVSGVLVRPTGTIRCADQRACCGSRPGVLDASVGDGLAA